MVQAHLIYHGTTPNLVQYSLAPANVEYIHKINEKGIKLIADQIKKHVPDFLRLSSWSWLSQRPTHLIPNTGQLILPTNINPAN